MIQSHIGEIAALLTALCWTVTAMSFEVAGKRIGSLAVNIIRLFFGLFFLCGFCWVYRGMVFPTDASVHAWIWLSISGLVGFAIGDLLLFQAFVMIGSRMSMLIMTLVPPITALISWLILGEVLTGVHLMGMSLTIFGIAMVILKKSSGQNGFVFSKPLAGLLFAFGGAFGQAGGLVLSKYGMQDYDPFAATQIRIIAGIVSFLVLFTVWGKWPRVRSAIRETRAMLFTALGSFFGPFLGVSFSLLSVQYALTGVASTIMSITPILLIPPAVIFLKERITFREILGAAAAIAGVAILFLF